MAFSVTTKHWPILLAAICLQTMATYGMPLGPEEAAEKKPARTADPIKFLGEFGYLTRDESNGQNSLASEVLESAVREFQKFANLKETGVLDEKTKELMSADRCGNMDVDKAEAVSGRNGTLQNPYAWSDDEDEQAEEVRPGEFNKASNETFSKANETNLMRVKRYLRRYKRYALAGAKWPRLTVTYRTKRYSSRQNVQPDGWDQTLTEALGIWGAVVPLKFERRQSGKADIEVSFVKGEHADCSKDLIDNGVLAHAYPPGKNPINGDIHFNDHQKWTLAKKKGKGLLPVLPVAIHEIGHALGIKHSSEDEAIMYPYDKGLLQLAPDDKRAIRQLYGKKKRINGGGRTSSADGDRRGPTGGLECAQGQRYARVPADCTQFIDCGGFKPVIKYCPPSLFWLQSKQWCDYPHNVPECNSRANNNEDDSAQTIAPSADYGAGVSTAAPDEGGADTSQAPDEPNVDLPSEPSVAENPGEGDQPSDGASEPTLGADGESLDNPTGEQEGEGELAGDDASSNGEPGELRAFRRRTRKRPASKKKAPIK